MRRTLDRGAAQALADILVEDAGEAALALGVVFTVELIPDGDGFALKVARKPVEDPWHVGELPGDDGRTIRDENGLTVCTAPSREAAEELVEDHNRGA